MSYALGILPRAQRELGALPTETISDFEKPYSHSLMSHAPRVLER